MSAPSKDVQGNKTGACLIPPKLYNPSTLNIDLVGGWLKNLTKNEQYGVANKDMVSYSVMKLFWVKITKD
jgi:hypothetical protein